MKRMLLLGVAMLMCVGVLAFADGTPTAAERFFTAARGGDVDTVKSMLDGKEAQVNQQEAGSRLTALMIGVQQQNLNLVLALISYGPDPALKDAKGKTAYTYAKESGNVAVMNALKQAGLDKE